MADDHNTRRVQTPAPQRPQMDAAMRRQQPWYTARQRFLKGRPGNRIDFLAESNRIEGIDGVSEAEISAAVAFLGLEALTVAAVEAYVAVTQPGAVLRTEPGVNVRVGNRIAPPGGPAIGYALDDLLGRINAGAIGPYAAHVEYETLHPFVDGNGRSGRLIWLWQMQRYGGAPLGFLHTFYYQAMDGG